MKELSLGRGGRLHAAYAWSLDIWLCFRDDPHEARRYRDGDNLCHLIRIVAVCAPLAVGSQLLAILFVWECLIRVPLSWFGVSYFVVVAGIGAIIAGLCGLVALIGKFSRRRATGCEFEDKPVSGRTSTFRELIDAYKNSKLHDKICPWVSFVDLDENVDKSPDEESR